MTELNFPPYPFLPWFLKDIWPRRLFISNFETITKVRLMILHIYIVWILSHPTSDLSIVKSKKKRNRSPHHKEELGIVILKKISWGLSNLCLFRVCERIEEQSIRSGTHRFISHFESSTKVTLLLLHIQLTSSHRTSTTFAPTLSIHSHSPTTYTHSALSTNLQLPLPSTVYSLKWREGDSMSHARVMLSRIKLSNCV